VRRHRGERRTSEVAVETERRLVRGTSGRRVSDRRAPTAAVDLPGILPRRLRAHVDRLAFVERLEPSTQQLEDRDTARLVARFQSGEPDVFSTLYSRYFDRVYSYLKVALRDGYDAEDGTQQVFIRVLEALPRYERTGAPFRAWLFRIVRNHAVDELRKRHRIDVVEPDEMTSLSVMNRQGQPDLAGLDWVSDRELLMFVERLPVPQQQVLMLRFMLDLRVSEVAEILGRTPNNVSALQHRALEYLRERLEVVRQGSRQRTRQPASRFTPAARVLRRRRYALML
jgi:RNA polymerase sigma-70 factor (ECF subfamily)